MSSNVLISLKYHCVHYYFLMRKITGILALWGALLLTACVPTLDSEIETPEPTETAVPEEPTEEPIPPLKEHIGTNWQAMGDYLQAKNFIGGLISVYYFPRLGEFDLGALRERGSGQIDFLRTESMLQAVSVSSEVVPASGLTPGSTEYFLKLTPMFPGGITAEPQTLHLGSSTNECQQSWQLQAVFDDENLAFVFNDIRSCAEIAKESTFFLIDLHTGSAVWDSTISGDGIYAVVNDRIIIYNHDDFGRCLDIRIYDHRTNTTEFVIDGVDRNSASNCNPVQQGSLFEDIVYFSLGTNRDQVGYDFTQQKETAVADNIESLIAYDPNTQTVVTQTQRFNRAPDELIVRNIKTQEVLFALSTEQTDALKARAKGLAENLLYLETSSEKLIIDLTIADEDEQIISTNYTRLPLLSLPGYILYDDGYIESINETR